MLKKCNLLLLSALVLFLFPLQVFAADMTPEELLKKSNEAMMNLDSYSMKQVSKAKMPMMNEGEGMETKTMADVTMDPLAFYMKTELAGETTESYFTEQGYFSELPGQGWVQLSNDSSEEMMASMLAEGQMAQALPLAGDMSVEESDGSYVLQYEGDGEKLLELSMKMLQQGMGSSEGEQGLKELGEEILDKISINDVTYKMTIDKENHYLTSSHIQLEMEIETEEGQPMPITQETEMTLENFNGVGEIQIPQEVLDHAQPIEDAIGGELPDTASPNVMYALLGATMALFAGSVLFMRKRSVQ
ncbi:LPXTG cell wall anchor domain-containing protein [Halobacillus litoralis]|uniref:DUF6612 family protein n=1 Tax=Halobacillus litoralis TaxID=45668 RepID=UPI001CFEABE1|nr:DUF6612 family protein [Halobacillus litoralis]WLR46462.1 LPXTG cell wall anchor domain-containing protein [Halobacillus litoralis]